MDKAESRARRAVRRWPPPGIDTGRRAPWLSVPLTAERVHAITHYVRGVLLGDDSVEPDVELAEAGLSLLAGLVAADIELDAVLDELDGLGLP